MSRLLGITYGLATQGFFLVTVWYLYWFLYGVSGPPESGALTANALWSAAFAIPHSLLLHPAVRGRLSHWISSAFYGCFFCNVTCVTLLALIGQWHSSPIVIFDLQGLPGQLVRAGFYGSWVGLFYALYLSGLGWQTGLIPWWHWLRRLPSPRREFHPRSLYRWLRHPVYLCFLGLIWFNPRMTADRAVLTGIWTVYIFVGSWLKDHRLLYFLGDQYRAYQSEVPGYPFFPVGPLARIPWPEPENRVPPTTSPADSLPSAIQTKAA